MNDSTLKKYLIGSITAHFLIILIGAFLSHSTTIRHTFVVFGAHSKMPHKTLLKQFGNSSGARTGAANMQVAQLPVRKQAAKKVVPQVKKAPVKKIVAKTAVKKLEPAKPAPGVALDNSKPRSTEKKKTAPVAQKKQVVNKEPEPKLDAKNDKKIVEQKKVQEKVPEKKLDKKEVTKQESIKQEPLLPKAEPRKLAESEEQFVTAQPHELDANSFQAEDGEQFFAGQADQDNVTVAFTDREMLLYQRLVQQEIERTWQPPLGVPKGTECTVRFEVADNGNIKSVALVHRSDVLIFDLSTLRSARTCVFAQCLWGKIFQVDFRQ